MDSKSINNFVINIKASYIVNAFLYDYIDMKGYLDDIKEDNDPDEIKVVGYNFQNENLKSVRKARNDSIEKAETLLKNLNHLLLSESTNSRSRQRIIGVRRS